MENYVASADAVDFVRIASQRSGCRQIPQGHTDVCDVISFA